MYYRYTSEEVEYSEDIINIIDDYADMGWRLKQITITPDGRYKYLVVFEMEFSALEEARGFSVRLPKTSETLRLVG